MAEKQCTAPGHRCVADCNGLPNGNYPSCTGCETYTSCGDERTFLDLPCPPVSAPC